MYPMSDIRGTQNPTKAIWSDTQEPYLERVWCTYAPNSMGRRPKHLPPALQNSTSRRNNPGPEIALHAPCMEIRAKIQPQPAQAQTCECAYRLPRKVLPSLTKMNSDATTIPRRYDFCKRKRFLLR